jgi:hypothetical protein
MYTLFSRHPEPFIRTPCRHGRRLAFIVMAALAALPAASAAAQAPPGPPGPPPGNGSDLPAPPGTAPAFVPPGTPADIPGTATGPGLLNAEGVAFDRASRRFSLPFACQASGSVTVRVRGLSSRAARRGYSCTGNRAEVKLTAKKKAAKRIARRKRVKATATINQQGRVSKLDFVLYAGSRPEPVRGFWTDGRLQCSSDGSGAPPALVVEPDFTTRDPTPISTRAWVAWYTAAAGWHWLGVSGENAGRWDTWTATVQGIAQFHPDGAATPIPYTWGPISAPIGAGVFAVGVYEIVYWAGGRPDYQWQYVNAGTTGAAAAGGGTHYCAY